jgi:hypothetical protein
LLGSGHASAAAVCPLGLCRAILLGVEEQRRREGVIVPPVVSAAVARGVGIYSLAENSQSFPFLFVGKREEVD